MKVMRGVRILTGKDRLRFPPKAVAPEGFGFNGPPAPNRSGEEWQFGRRVKQRKRLEEAVCPCTLATAIFGKPCRRCARELAEWRRRNENVQRPG